jgi:putative modified peptide
MDQNFMTFHTEAQGEASTKVSSIDPQSARMPATLTPEQGVALVSRLAQDDAFRALFESDCAAALTQVGVPVQVVASLLAENAGSGCRLASKQRFAELLPALSEAPARRVMAFIVPACRFS